MTTTFRAHDGTHYLRLYDPAKPRLDGRHGQVWVNGEQPGLDETWRVEPAGDGTVSLSCHGVFLSGQPDGRLETRTWVRSWERWRLVPVDGGVGVRSEAFGFYVAAEDGGGDVAGARFGYERPLAWETFAMSGSAVVTPAGPLTRLRVEDNGRYFADDAGRFDWREISAFALLAYYQHGRGVQAKAWMAAARTLGFTVGRVLCTYTIGRDVIGHAGPDRPGYWDALAALCEDALAVGFRLRLCLFGALEPFGATWDPDARRGTYVGDVQRRGDAYALELVARVRQYPHVTIELSNEPVSTGFRDLDDALVGLGRQIRRAWPEVILNMGDVAGMNFDKAFDACFNAVDRHVDRDPELRFMHAQKRLGEVDFRDRQPRTMPAISGEPYNAGEERRDGRSGGSQGACPYPLTAFAYAAVCRARQILPTFHTDAGLYCTPLQLVTVECAQAFHAALDAFPMLLDRRWRGQHGLGAGDYWRDDWPADDDIRAVERHIREGRGPWRANGIGPWSVVFPEPLHWDYRAALQAPAERVAYMADDHFGVGIYRRS